MALIDQDRQQADGEANLCFASAPTARCRGSNREPSVMRLMPQRPHLSDEFSDHIRRQLDVFVNPTNGANTQAFPTIDHNSNSILVGHDVNGTGHGAA